MDILLLRCGLIHCTASAKGLVHGFWHHLALCWSIPVPLQLLQTIPVDTLGAVLSMLYTWLLYYRLPDTYLVITQHLQQLVAYGNGDLAGTSEVQQ